MTDRKALDWNDYGVYDRKLPTDWIHVASYDGGGYDWTTFHAFWSPAERRYYWHGGSGCSCSSWADGLYGPDDFMTGDRKALKRGFRAFVGEHCDIDAGIAIDINNKIARFKENR